MRDVDVFTKMDPLCEFSLVGFTDVKTSKSDFKTKTHQSGGKSPVWNEKFDMTLNITSDKINSGTGIIFKVIDEDIKHHDLIGESVIVSIVDLCSAVDKPKLHGIKLQHQNKETGLLNIEVSFKPKEVPKPPEPPKVEAPKPPARNLLPGMSKALNAKIKRQIPPPAPPQPVVQPPPPQPAPQPVVM